MEKLTNRELEVAELIAWGYDNKKISNKLIISHYTTRAHIASIYKKLEISNRIIVIKKLIEMGFGPARGYNKKN